MADATQDDASLAVADAGGSFNEWSNALPAEQSRILTRIAWRIRERAEEFVRIETLDNGKPLTQARGDVEGSVRYFESDIDSSGWFDHKEHTGLPWSRDDRKWPGT